MRRKGTVVGATLLGALLTAVLLSGCSQAILAAQPAATASGTASSAPVSVSPTAEPTPTPTAPAPAADSACDLLDEATLTALIGEAPPGKDVVVPGSSLPACEFGAIGSVGVQVARVPAADWAASLPSIVATMKALPSGSVDAAVVKQLEEAAVLVAAGRTFSADEACAYFSILAQAQGLPAESSQLVTYYPTLEEPIAVTGQQCVAGTFTSLLVSRPGLAVDQATYDQVIHELSRIG